MYGDIKVLQKLKFLIILLLKPLKMMHIQLYLPYLVCPIKKYNKKTGKNI